MNRKTVYLGAIIALLAASALPAAAQPRPNDVAPKTAPPLTQPVVPARAPTLPPPAPDLLVTKTAALDPAPAGGLLTYTLTLRNQGTSTATQVILSDTLPLNVTFVSATPSRGVCSESGGVVTCVDLLPTPLPFVNPGAETGDMTGWNIIFNGVDGWLATTDTPHQGSYSFITSYGTAWNTREQEIDLLAAGYSAAYLDSAPTLTAGEWIRGNDCGGTCSAADPYFLIVELHDAAHNPIASWNMGTNWAPVYATAIWTEQAHTFTDYGPGLRYLYLEDGGRDEENTSGHYGSQMDDAYANITAPGPFTLPPGDVVTVTLVTRVDAIGELVNTAWATLNEADWDTFDNTTTITTTSTCGDALTVWNNHDAGIGSLRQAILNLCADGRIDFDPSLAGQTIALTSAQLVITKNLTIDGSALATPVQISGNNARRVVWTTNNAQVTLAGLTLRQGQSDNGGALRVDSGAALTLTHSSVLSSTAQTGGGVYNAGALTVRNSTIAGNAADGSTPTTGSGGGIYTDSPIPVTVENSTISGNHAALHGGGIGAGSGVLHFSHSTIVNNVADYSGNGRGLGGGFAAYGTTEITFDRTIVAGNLTLGGADSDCAVVSPAGDGGIDSAGYNLVGYTSDCDLTAQPTDLLNQNALLGPLAGNGGPTRTHLPQPGSPAIDAIPILSCTLPVDQRDVARPQPFGGACDIGAVEIAPACLDAVTVRNASDSAPLSLRYAIEHLCPGGRIDFDDLLAGQTITLTSAGLVISKSMTVDGSALAAPVQISGDDTWRVLAVTNGAHVTLDSLIVAHGLGSNDYCSTIPTCGGGIMVEAGAALTLTHSAVLSSTAQFGGGIFHEGPLVLHDSVVAGNSGDYVSGGVYASGTTLTVQDSVISGNLSNGDGGGLYNYTGAATVDNSAISGNSAAGWGGGILNYGTMSIANSTLSGNTALGGGGITSGYLLHMTNCTVSGNRAAQNGGGIQAVYTSGDVFVDHSTIVSNTADFDGGDDGSGGGLAASSNGSSIIITHTIVAGNVDAGGETPDCYVYVYVEDHNISGTIDSHGYNLIGDTTGCTLTTSPTDLLGQDPLLGPLADNGGGTWTHAMPLPSPAVDAIPAISCTLTTDQRGVARPQYNACDIGAYELALQQVFLPLVLRN